MGTTKKEGDDAIEAWIDEQLNNTSVTAVLIGAKTSNRKWVNYEIKQSIEDGNGLLGVRIHNIKDKNENTDVPGSNPLSNHTVQLPDGTSQSASSYYNTYDWDTDDGRDNLGAWIEEAASLANR